jgi:hypothetical protein
MNGFFQYFSIFYNCDMFKSIQNFIISPIAFFGVICCYTPILICIFVNLVCLAVYLVCCCPPLAILTSALPCLRSSDYGVFNFTEKINQRADPSDHGHVTMWYEIGWVRAFFICCALTCFGFFPGVFFATFVAVNHLMGFY